MLVAMLDSVLYNGNSKHKPNAVDFSVAQVKSMLWNGNSNGTLSVMQCLSR